MSIQRNYMSSAELEALPPNTVTNAFLETVGKHKDKVALRYAVVKPDADPRAEKFADLFTQISYTWGQYHEQASRFAKSLLQHDIKRGSAVTIQGANSPYWFFANMGSMLAGSVSTGIYPTNSPAATQSCTVNSDAQVVVVEDEKQLRKYENMMSAVKCYVVWNKVSDSLKEMNQKPVYSWDEFLTQGQQVTDERLDKRIKKQRPDDVCSIIYTSGTTGMPKAAMLTHDNMFWTGFGAKRGFGLNENDHGISYLPLSHIAAQQVDSTAALIFGYQMDIAPPGALKGSGMKIHILNTRPTFFLAVPDVWDKMRDGMMDKMKQAKGFSAQAKKLLFNVVTPIARFCVQDLQKIAARNYSKDSMWHVADVVRGIFDKFVIALCERLLLTKVKGLMGLDRCSVAASGSAPIAPEVVNFFAGLNIRIVDLYGMSETSGLITLSDASTPRGSVGKALPGTKVILFNPDKTGEGEICVHISGRNMFKGYRNDVKATQEVTDQEGYFHTGDLGRMDEQGNVRITGRLKELIKNHGGENIPPVVIESNIKKHLPIVSQVVVIGDKRKYLTCLVTLKTVVDSDNNPTNQLAQPIPGSSAKTVEEAANDPVVQSFIKAGIDEANKEAISNAQNVQKVKILTQDFTVANGYLTPTMKLKRSKVNLDFAAQINEMYA